MTDRNNGGARRKSLLTADKTCLSCRHSEITTARGQLQIYCQKNHLSNNGHCADYLDSGTSRLLLAIKERVRGAQQNYRGRFNILQPACDSCVQNCCTTPFLDRTPFYPEDALYYLLSDQPVPNVPKALKHCMFFNQGCTLPATLRPHVCIEYKCIYLNDGTLDELGNTINFATIDLLAVATRDFVGWRGEYTIENKAALKRRGFAAGKIYDRFDREWDPQNPLADLYRYYGVNITENERRGA
jgi:hypothetical protein